MTSRQALRDAARGSALDRAISWLAPTWGARRLRARAFMAVAGGYIGGDRGRRATKGWTRSGTDADSDLSDRETLIERSQDLARNSPLARGAINTNVTSVVGAGLTLSASVDRDVLGWSEDQAADWEARAEREWRLWAESPECDLERRMTFYDLTAVAFRSYLECGDVFALLPMVARPGSPYRTRVQLIEAPRVSNPQFGVDRIGLIGGVEKDQHGAAVAFHICRAHPHSLIPDAERMRWDRVAAFGERTGRPNVIHLARLLRPGQTRGEPYLAPVIEPLKQLTRYSEAELMAAVVAAMFTVFVKSDSGAGAFDPFNANEEATTGQEDYALGNGAIVGLADGESIETANPGRPNAAFTAFYDAMSREIGVALDLPNEVLIKAFLSSYSASMAALLEAWRVFLTRRAVLGRSWCQPIYEAVLAESVALGRLEAPGFLRGDPLLRQAYCRSTWNGPARGQIREDVETAAAEKRIEIGISTRKREAAQITGLDSEQVHAQLVKEHRARVQDGLTQAAPVAAPSDRQPAREDDREDPDDATD